MREKAEFELLRHRGRCALVSMFLRSLIVLGEPTASSKKPNLEYTPLEAEALGQRQPGLASSFQNGSGLAQFATSSRADV